MDNLPGSRDGLEPTPAPGLYRVWPFDLSDSTRGEQETREAVVFVTFYQARNPHLRSHVISLSCVFHSQEAVTPCRSTCRSRSWGRRAIIQELLAAPA